MRGAAKEAARGLDFAAGERMLAPVQAKRRTVQRQSAPDAATAPTAARDGAAGPATSDASTPSDAPAPSLSEAQTSALVAILPFLASSLRTEDSLLPAALARVAKETGGMLEQGSTEDEAYSLLLNWVALLSKEYVSPASNRTLLQVQLLDAFADAGAARSSSIPADARDTRAKLDNWLVRVRAMRAFYASMMKGAARPGEMPEQEPVSGLRQTIVGLGLAQVGKVHAGQQTDVDDKGRPARRGWRTLQRIYDMAFGGTYADEEGIKRKRLERRPKQGAKRQDDGTYAAEDMHDADAIGSWCGIFATAIARQAGAGVPDWKSGGVKSMPRVTAPDVPRPGDAVNKSANNHFGLITWVGPLPEKRTQAELDKVELRTVEGNVGNGQILELTSKVKDWNWGIHQVEPPPRATPAAKEST